MSAGADRNAVQMAGAFLGRGGWAAWANAAQPMPAPLLAGVLQGTLSATITLGLKRMVETVAARQPGLAGIVLPAALACGLSVTLLGTARRLAGTPEVLLTLAEPTTVATIHDAAYAWRLRRHG